MWLLLLYSLVAHGGYDDDYDNDYSSYSCGPFSLYERSSKTLDDETECKFWRRFSGHWEKIDGFYQFFVDYEYYEYDCL